MHGRWNRYSNFSSFWIFENLLILETQRWLRNMIFTPEKSLYSIARQRLASEEVLFNPTESACFIISPLVFSYTYSFKSESPKFWQEQLKNIRQCHNILIWRQAALNTKYLLMLWIPSSALATEKYSSLAWGIQAFCH